MQKKYPRLWLPAAAEGFVLSHVFLPDRDVAFELDLDLRLSDDICTVFEVQVSPPKHFCSFFAEQRNVKSTPAFSAVSGC